MISPLCDSSRSLCLLYLSLSSCRCLSVCLSVCLYVCLSVCLYVCLSCSRLALIQRSIDFDNLVSKVRVLSKAINAHIMPNQVE